MSLTRLCPPELHEKPFVNFWLAADATADSIWATRRTAGLGTLCGVGVVVLAPPGGAVCSGTDAHAGGFSTVMAMRPLTEQ
jgi:hypothetical protein